MKSIYGDELEYNAEYDILKRIKDFPSGASKPEIYAACGTEDDLRSDSLSLRDTMTNTGFDFTYEEWTGDHDWYFFSDALKKAIEHWYK